MYATTHVHTYTVHLNAYADAGEGVAVKARDVHYTIYPCVICAPIVRRRSFPPFVDAVLNTYARYIGDAAAAMGIDKLACMCACVRVDAASLACSGPVQSREKERERDRSVTSRRHSENNI